MKNTINSMKFISFLVLLGLSILFYKGYREHSRHTCYEGVQYLLDYMQNMHYPLIEIEKEIDEAMRKCNSR